MWGGSSLEEKEKKTELLDVTEVSLQTFKSASHKRVEGQSS